MQVIYRESFMKIKSLLFFLLLPFFVQAKLNWQFQTDGMVAGKPVVVKHNVYVTGGKYLYALDKQGNLKWRYAIGDKSFSQVAVNKKVIYVLADNGLHAINNQGKKLWQFNSSDTALAVEGKTWGWGEGKFLDPWAWYRSSPIFVQGKVIFANAQGTYAIDAMTGKQLWHTPTGVTHTTPAHSKNTIVVGSWDNHLYALDFATGEIKWRVAGEMPQGGWQGWNGFNLSPVIDNGVVYAPTRGGYVYAIDVESGIEQWSAKHPSTWIGSPVIVSNGSIYYGLSDGYSVIGRDAKTGVLNLLFKNKFYNFAQPQVKGNKIFAADLAGRLFAINAETGIGEAIFSTQESRNNLKGMLQEQGGFKAIYNVKGAYSNENMSKDVKLMHNKLDSILTMTLDDDTLYLGSARGKVYAVSL